MGFEWGGGFIQGFGFSGRATGAPPGLPSSRAPVTHHFIRKPPLTGLMNERGWDVGGPTEAGDGFWRAGGLRLGRGGSVLAEIRVAQPLRTSTLRSRVRSRGGSRSVDEAEDVTNPGDDGRRWRWTLERRVGERTRVTVGIADSVTEEIPAAHRAAHRETTGVQAQG